MTQLTSRKSHHQKLWRLIWSSGHFCSGKCALRYSLNEALRSDNLKCRAWQTRRVVVTKEMIGFARVGENILIDTIPLAEVEFIRDMHSIDEEIDKAKFLNALMITTIPEVHNSGRTYYLQASSDEHCKRIVSDWIKLASKARLNAEANTKCAESQQFFRKIFDSSIFQLVSASLIIAVIFI